MGTVVIESKDDITAGDGARRAILNRKSVYATTTTANVFKLLNAAGIRTHYVRRLSSRKFEARHVGMIPLEIVIRRIATGSYLRRNPGVVEGTIFDPLVVEFFLKDDARHDPFIRFAWEEGNMWLFDAKSPSDEAIGIESLDDWRIQGKRKARLRLIDEHLVIDLGAIARHVFLTLETAWKRLEVDLVDLKIECGFDRETGELLVGDVIDNDSWRIWPLGEKDQAQDKQVFRDLKEVTDEAMDDVGDKYRRVAAWTDRFLEQRPRATSSWRLAQAIAS